ncbi:hypothetical protein GOEFS_082_00020 [Gordonia effusa NBRC 100432]|uniref:Uncharacterized protein n=1 Tax=Gordonia effusa NBRC 100432 TaxID=1077974 RepID=H0R2R7_9ACTN|nr:hypothetical protein [Gordonia effusa]GAB19368.1 hypothetical protein GOEFS_082_00020 [Gordonia effusa NBRC 100432]
MKRRDVIKRLGKVAKAKGERLILTEGGSHTLAAIGDRKTTIPRHNEINELTAKSIIKYMEAEQ